MQRTEINSKQKPEQGEQHSSVFTSRLAFVFVTTRGLHCTAHELYVMISWAESPSKRTWCHPHGVCFWEFGQKHAHEDPAGGDVLLIFLAQRSRYQSRCSRVSYNCVSSGFPSTLLILCLETQQTFFWQLNYLCSCHRLQVQQVVNI